ncbi:Uncharacterised protein [Citrobacter freundii]|nr:Uncharacterised protein [Citrobacter freundii]
MLKKETSLLLVSLKNNKNLAFGVAVMNRILLAALTYLFASMTFYAQPQNRDRSPRIRSVPARSMFSINPLSLLQAKFGLTTPEERVLRIRNTLRNFTQADVREPLKIVPVTRYNQQGRADCG